MSLKKVHNQWLDWKGVKPRDWENEVKKRLHSQLAFGDMPRKELEAILDIYREEELKESFDTLIQSVQEESKQDVVLATDSDLEESVGL